MSVGMRKPTKIRIDDIHLDPVTLAGYETPEQQERINSMAKSLKVKGQLEPIIINPDLATIWRGHTRYFAAKKLKWEFIEAIVVDGKEWNDYIGSNGAQI